MRRIHRRADPAQESVIFITGQFKKILLKFLKSRILHDHEVKHFFQLFRAFRLVNQSLQVLTGLIGDLFHENAAEYGHGEFFGCSFVEIVFGRDADHFGGEDLDSAIFW